MQDFYEFDFLPVHSSMSGDAIAIRYRVGQYWSVHLVDGGYQSTAADVSLHIQRVYGTTRINRMVVTHPDQDHAEGLAPILSDFEVESLWMLRPWAYAAQLLPHFSQYSRVDNLIARLREDYPYIARLEEIAFARGIPILEPLQGAQLGPFTVLAPSLGRYLGLVIRSDRTPRQSAASRSAFTLIGQAMLREQRLRSLVTAGWGNENFSSEDTSAENEMSVVQFAQIAGSRTLLTGDAGREALTEAADYAPAIGLQLPGIDNFQAPHHGGRRNLSSALLDRWVGPRLRDLTAPGLERFNAMISSAKEDEEHPRLAVIRALHHRGAFIATTEDAPFYISSTTAPARGWSPMSNLPYPQRQEA